MSGQIGLHGGGEYLAGDEPFLDALLTAAARRRGSDALDGTPASSGREALDRGSDALDGTGGSSGPAAMDPIRVVIVPTAAGRGQPDRAAANGVDAFRRRAAVLGLPATVEAARVVDRSSAADPRYVDMITRADLIHVPGGDPDLIPTVLNGSPALDAIRDAWLRGAVLAGASAGAMALAEWTWTPQGGLRGLGASRMIIFVTWSVTLTYLAR